MNENLNKNMKESKDVKDKNKAVEVICRKYEDYKLLILITQTIFLGLGLILMIATLLAIINTIILSI